MSHKDGILFDRRFLQTLRQFVSTHYTVYPQLPPQGIYFESLVERAFLKAGWPRDRLMLLEWRQRIRD